jgi:hypothetical protein
MANSTFSTSIYIYDPVLDGDVYTPVHVEYIYEREWPSTEYDPGEPELFEICSIVDKNTGIELTEEHIDMDMICEELEKEIRETLEDEKNFVEVYDDYEY